MLFTKIHARINDDITLHWLKNCTESPNYLLKHEKIVSTIAANERLLEASLAEISIDQ